MSSTHVGQISKLITEAKVFVIETIFLHCLSMLMMETDTYKAQFSISFVLILNGFFAQRLNSGGPWIHTSKLEG